MNSNMIHWNQNGLQAGIGLTHEDIILRNPRFSTIERFLICGGGGAFDMYNRMMELMYRKDTKTSLQTI